MRTALAVNYVNSTAWSRQIEREMTDEELFKYMLDEAQIYPEEIFVFDGTMTRNLNVEEIHEISHGGLEAYGFDDQGEFRRIDE